MKNLWPDSFEENTKLSAKNLLEEQAKLLLKITNGVVFAEVVEMSQLDAIQYSINDDFTYSFNIRGKFLEGYSFKAMWFSHDVTLYPVNFRLDEQLAREFEIQDPLKRRRIVDPDKLETFIGEVLTSKRIKNVVGSILKLSK